MSTVRFDRFNGTTWERYGRPISTTPVTPPATFTRPTGLNAFGGAYVRFEDVYTSSMGPSAYALQKVFDALRGSGKTLTMPEGTWYGGDFVNGYRTSLYYDNNNYSGMVGSGPNTIIMIPANVLTNPTDVGDKSVQYWAMQGRGEWGQFTLNGEDQAAAGGLTVQYNGLSAYNSNCLVYDIQGNGWRGNRNSPQDYAHGEAGLVVTQAAHNSTFLRVHADGEKQRSSPMMFNNSNNVQVTDCVSINSGAGMTTFYNCSNVTTLRLRSENHGTSGTGAQGLSGTPINHERNFGTFRHINSILTIDPSMISTNPWHASWESDHSNSSTATISFEDVTFSSVSGHPNTLFVHVPGTYAGVADTAPVSGISVLVGGVSQPRKTGWNVWGDSGPMA